jgi:hypothetical protein
MFETVKKKVLGVTDRVAARVVAFAMFCMCLVTSAFAEVTIPNCLGTGVTMGDYITAAITTLGAVVAVVVGGYFAFRIVVMGMKWVRHLGS